MPGPFRVFACSGPLNWHLDWTHAGRKVTPVAAGNQFDGLWSKETDGMTWDARGSVGKKDLQKGNTQIWSETPANSILIYIFVRFHRLMIFIFKRQIASSHRWANFIKKK